jgi:hypothetical protein
VEPASELNVCPRCKGWKPKDRPACRKCITPAELKDPLKGARAPVWGLENAILDMSLPMGLVLIAVGFGGFVLMWIGGYFWPWIVVVGVLGCVNVYRHFRREELKAKAARMRRQRERAKEAARKARE